MTFWEKDELHPNSTCGMIQHDVPTEPIENLPEFVTMLLDGYENAGSLIWTGISQDDVWVKIGGDHEADSFKISIQIANQSNPN